MYKNSNALRTSEWNGMGPQVLTRVHSLQVAIKNWLHDGGEVQLVRVHCCHQRKVIAEFDIVTQGASDRGWRRRIGKTYTDDRGRQVFDMQRPLWDGGFRPPSSLTVARPITYLEDAKLFFRKKAPGSPVRDLMFKTARAPLPAVVAVARWLATFHSSPIRTPPRLPIVRSRLLRYGVELARALAAHAKRIEYLTEAILSRMEDAGPRSSWVPTHGDLHPGNMYVAKDGRVTAVDLDTVGVQEREADVGYFLAQTAIMGYFLYGRSFTETQTVRDSFLGTYEESAGALRRDRIGLYVGHAFLQSLHYEICVLKNDRPQIIEPWLQSAGHGLEPGPLALAEPAGRSTGAACLHQRST